MWLGRLWGRSTVSWVRVSIREKHAPRMDGALCGELRVPRALCGTQMRAPVTRPCFPRP